MTTATRQPTKQRKLATLAKQEARLGWFLVLPAATVVLGLVLFPVLWNLVLSTQRIRLIELQNVGLFDLEWNFENYGRVVGVRDFWEVVRTTFVYTIAGTFLSLAGGLWAALVVRKAFVGRSLVRGFILFPYIAPIIAVTFVWTVMLNVNFGIINEWLTSLGFSQIDFLGQRAMDVSIFGWEFELPVALTTVIVFEAWRYFPFAFLFILAALQGLPEDIDEAAMVDGATLTQRFWYVTLPQLRGVFSVLFVLRFIWTFNKFDDIWLLTGGAAGTRVITVSIIEWLRGRGDIGSAAALGVILAGTLAILLFIYFKWFFEEETA